ncbi:lactate dehydrogenase [Photobacterium aquae]|uniref:Lactate dehydrogenase n=1 Tax=Photobacterium aquae TaxID=1195763 RepID=A0A0J1GVH6_9GAMM|nr:lactate dehydrogenase [Photobacterium aquae]KLV03683.1 lactate dehydrogenase [Photobacterium aquae]
MINTDRTDNDVSLLPEAANNQQLNHCKTVGCVNFGSTDPNHYVLQRNNPNKPLLVCRECGAFPPLINNQDVMQEVRRLRQQQTCGLPACTNPDCENITLPVLTHRQHYHAFGFSGDRQRYRCKSCQTTFVDRWSGFNTKNTLQQKLLAMLFTGYSVRDICRRLKMNPKSFYDQLSHIASRCRRQLAMFDARLCKHSKQLSLASNIRVLQPQSENGVNWIASCEAFSGYVLAQDTNYQSSDAETLSEQHDPYQTGTRFMAHPPAQIIEVPPSQPQGLLARIDGTYRAVMSRPNLENPLTSLPRINYPAKGCLIRPQYTVYAHYLYLREMLTDNETLSIFMPQEPLLRSACISIFTDRIKARTLHPVYVEADAGWQHGQPANKVDIVMMGWWRDRWAFTRDGELSKGICHLGGEKGNETKWLEHASHDTVRRYQQRFHDQFSQLVNEPRRKLRPGGLMPLLDIYRAWHNLCHQEKNGLTPAQQIGLVNAPLTLEQLLS